MATRNPASKSTVPTPADRRTAVAKPTAAMPAGPAKAGPAAKKAAKQRAKLVRDGFTMPADDFALIAALKVRALSAGREARKSELLRAGLHALSALEAPALLAALGRLQPVKTGRPKKGS